MIDLKSILLKHPEAAGDSGQMKGLLLDKYRDYEKPYEISILISFIDSGITEELKNKKINNEVITPADKERYIRKLEKQYGYQKDRIEPIFNLWIDALELEYDDGEEIEPKDNGNSAVTPTDISPEPKQQDPPKSAKSKKPAKSSNIWYSPDPPKPPKREPFRFGMRHLVKAAVLIIILAIAAAVIYFVSHKIQKVRNIAPTATVYHVSTAEKPAAASEVIRLTAFVRWEDDSDRDGKRPDSVKVRVFADSEQIHTINVGPESGWNASLSDLPKYRGSGEEIIYTVAEDPVYGYITEVDGFTVTNRHDPETVDASVRIFWDDADDRDGIRPETMKITMSGGTVVILDRENNWTAGVAGLPKYDGGQEILYTWTEDRLPEGYELTASEKFGMATVLTCSHTPETTELTVSMIWDDADDQDGIRPDTLTLVLNDGTRVVVSGENDWTQTVSGLPKYAGGEKIEYSWSEPVLPEGYTLTGSSGYGTFTTLTNSHTPETTEAAVLYVWDDREDLDGLRPAEQTVILSSGTFVTLSEDSGWTKTVSGLPKYAEGEEIIYTWKEAPAPFGYELTGRSASGTLTTLTYSHTPKSTAADVPAAIQNSEVQVGDILTFGRYEQDNNTDNGPEDIEWQILAVEDDRALLISRYGLDTKPYNEEYVGVTWETCTLRKWLNGVFYDSAFSLSERGRIREVLNQNPDNPNHLTKGGNDTKDWIFLLSIYEVNNYFSNDDSRMCEATSYAKANGAGVDDVNGDSRWWLRSPGGNIISSTLWSGHAAEVDCDGNVNTYGYAVNNTGAVVRIAFWLDLSEPQDSSDNKMIPAAAATEALETEIEGIEAEEMLTLPTAAPTAIPISDYYMGDILILPTAAPTAISISDISISDYYMGDILFLPTAAPTAAFEQEIQVGDILTFGRYEQDNNTDNGPEDIEWQILAVEDVRVLLISRYALDAKPYNENFADVTWETCTLRAWLNGEFYDSAFSPEEKGRIREVINPNPDNPDWGTTGGNVTADRFFLLSIDEVNKYFSDDGSRMCEATAYAKAKRAGADNENGNSWWWLRSPGMSVYHALSVGTDGCVYEWRGVHFTDTGVRVAFWLDL